MSKRSEIIDGKLAARERYGLVYTEVLGWIDLGHAQGTDIRNLLSKMLRGESSKKEFYDVTYSQGMSKNWGWGSIRSGKMLKWRIKRGRHYFEQQSIALAMMLSTARKFESFQSSFPNNVVTDSGFSGEDLVSNLLGFYRVASIQNPFDLLRPVSKSEALKRWDFYGEIGKWKNESFLPLLFPDPERFPRAKPRRDVLPPFMQSVRPYNNSSSDNVVTLSSDKTFIVLGTENGRMKL